MSETDIILKKEDERLNTLRKYDILDTEPDNSFDRITTLTAKLFDVPIALVTLVDTERMWFKSRYGIDVAEMSLDKGAYISSILSDEIYIIEDAARDIESAANPLVPKVAGLQFYAAAKLKVKGGHNLGMLCIVDTRPRQLSKADQQILQSLAEILVEKIELRLASKIAVSRQNLLLNVAAHDLKNPLTTIPLWADLVKVENNETTREFMCRKITDASTKMLKVITELLESASIEAHQVQLHNVNLNFAGVIERVSATNKILANNKGQTLIINIEDQPVIYGDEDKIGEIADNLINNAIKYSPTNSTITVNVKKANNVAVMEVHDEGQGLSAEDKKHLFQRFKRLSSQPTGNETATGLGLSIVKVLVEAHNGTISAESKGKNKGSVFIVEIPLLV